MTSDLKKCFVEFTGTFFLCFTILCCVLLQVNAVLAPIVIGFVLAVLVYAGGPVSGAHYNPAVSISIFLIGRMGLKKTILYCIFQIFGGAYAALIMMFLSSVYTVPEAKGFLITPLLIAEVIFTTLLIFVVMFTAVSKKVSGNGYFGFAIGSSLLVGVGTAGSICLTAFNPAVAISLGLTSIAAFKIVGITIIANLLASVLSCVLFKLFNLDDAENVEIVEVDEFIRK